MMSRVYFSVTLLLISLALPLRAQELLITCGDDKIDSVANKAIQVANQNLAKNFFTAINLADEAVKIAEREKNLKGGAVARFAKATILIKAASYNTAQSELTKAIASIQKITNETERDNMLAFAYHYMGFNFQSQSDWVPSLNNYYRALGLAQKAHNLDEEINLLIRIGELFFAIDNPSASKKYLSEALTKSDKSNMPIIKIQSLVAYAYILSSSSPDKAIDLCNKAIDIAQHKNEVSKDYNIYFTLAGAYFSAQKLDKAIEHLNKAINSAQSLGKPLSQYYIAFAEIYKVMNKLVESENYYKLAIAETQKENDIYMEYQATSLLNNFYKETHNSQKLLETIERSYLLKDSIYTIKQMIAIHEMDYRYQSEKKEAAIISLTRENRWKGGVMIISAIAILALILLIFNYKKRIELQSENYKAREKALEQEKFIATQQAQLQKEQKEIALLNEKLTEEENISLQREIANTQRELASTTIYIQEKNNILEQLQEQILDLLKHEKHGHKEQLKSINHSIKKQLSFERDWSKIKYHFDKVHPDFFNQLTKICPDLTQNDLRNCAYIKMKLSNKDIANLTGIDYNSVKMSHYRIKKKLKLKKEDNLATFIENL